MLSVGCVAYVLCVMSVPIVARVAKDASVVRLARVAIVPRVCGFYNVKNSHAKYISNNRFHASIYEQVLNNFDFTFER